MILYLLVALLCLALAVALWVNRSLRARVALQREWLRRHSKLARLSRRDALTGLPNRLHFERLLPRLLARASRQWAGSQSASPQWASPQCASPQWASPQSANSAGTRLALLYVDLDHFKDLSNTLGHARCDDLLITTARRLRASLASHDIVVRMGSDEFLVIATLLPQAEVVNTIANRIRSVLQLPLEIDGRTVSITASLGISVYPEDGTDPEQLLSCAAIALYHAKTLGGGNHQFYTREMSLPRSPGPLSNSAAAASWTASAGRGSTSARR
jgi:diguanylate cyclase